MSQAPERCQQCGAAIATAGLCSACHEAVVEQAGVRIADARNLWGPAEESPVLTDAERQRVEELCARPDAWAEASSYLPCLLREIKALRHELERAAWRAGEAAGKADPQQWRSELLDLQSRIGELLRARGYTEERPRDAQEDA